MRVNGLYGWVQRNDARTLVFLGAFALLSQLMAMIVLIGPLIYLDRAHAPWFAWGGYALRYPPLVALAAGAYFLFEMARDVGAVRRDAPYRFVDSKEEPRLCGLVEPLAIALGLDAPYVGVMETAPLNAFACGARRRDATLVVTRGLLDALDDDELAAVIAHELVHVKNGDTRTLAAANVFMRTLYGMSRLDMSRHGRHNYFAITPILTGACLRLGRASRLLLSSAREFVADAEAARLTQHPAALISALRKIAGRSALPHLPPAYEAMMFDGIANGADANHPTIDARIQAVVAMTGAVALEERPRRDSRLRRPEPAAPAEGVAIREQMRGLLRVAVVAEAPRQGLRDAFARVAIPALPRGPDLTWGKALAFVAVLIAIPLFNYGGFSHSAGGVPHRPEGAAKASPPACGGDGRSACGTDAGLKAHVGGASAHAMSGGPR